MVHRTLLREYSLLPARMHALPPAGATARRVRELHDLIRVAADVHFHTEEHVVWPRLRQHAAGAADTALASTSAQHEHLAGLMARCGRLVEAWSRQPGAPQAAAARRAISELTDALDGHFRLEEEQVLPLVARFLTNREWRLALRFGRSSLPRRHVAVFLGALLLGADTADRRAVLAMVPAPLRPIASMLGPRSYGRRTRRLSPPSGTPIVDEGTHAPGWAGDRPDAEHRPARRSAGGHRA